MAEEIKVIIERNSRIFGNGNSSLQSRLLFYDTSGGVEFEETSEARAFPFKIEQNTYLIPISPEQTEEINQYREYTHSENVPGGLIQKSRKIQTTTFPEFDHLREIVLNEEPKIPSLRGLWKKHSHIMDSGNFNEFLSDLYQMVQTQKR